MTTLVVGATGFLGSNICGKLRGAGRPCRGLVRTTSKPERVAPLEALGVELCTGDLKSPATLAPALVGVKTLISTASSVLSTVEGDTIESVDLRGQLHLIDAAKRANVEHFVFVSFHRHEVEVSPGVRKPFEFPLQTAKRAVESQLISSGISYTILQPVDFTEVWLGPAVGFDLLGGKVTVLGDGAAKTTWISLDDVAKFAAGAVENPLARQRIFGLGGPDALSQLEVVELFRAASGRDVKVNPETMDALNTAFAEASDPLARSFAALKLATARGQTASSTAALEATPLKLSSVTDYIQFLLKSQAR